MISEPKHYGLVFASNPEEHDGLEFVSRGETAASTESKETISSDPSNTSLRISSRRYRGTSTACSGISSSVCAFNPPYRRSRC
jgi:hypothetical protein